MILPVLSVYIISRFTGLLIIQTVSSVAIISNAVFFMISMCFVVISAIDMIHSIIIIPEKRKRRLLFSSNLRCAFWNFFGNIFVLRFTIIFRLGGSVFILAGVTAVVIGVLSMIINPLKNMFPKIKFLLYNQKGRAMICLKSLHALIA